MRMKHGQGRSLCPVSYSQLAVGDLDPFQPMSVLSYVGSNFSQLITGRLAHIDTWLHMASASSAADA